MTLETQWLALATMFVSGMLLGVFLDLYRVLKGKWGLTGWVVALVDLCYWILAAGWVFSVLLWSTWGELRFYMLVVLFLGLGVYYLWLSRPAITVILFVIRIVQALIRLIVTLLRLCIWTPMMFIGMCCWAVARMLGKSLLVVLRGLAWLFRPLWRPLQPLLRPIYLPLYEFFSQWYRLAASAWHKVKHGLFRRK